MYIKRIAEKRLEHLLKNASAISIVGPKWCGKTELAKRFANSSIIINSKTVKRIKEFGDDFVLAGDNPRLIDEWQVCPPLWDAVRENIDKRPFGNKIGLYMLTGSSKPFDQNEIIHDGAGRFVTLNLQTLTFAEIFANNDSNKVSLIDLFESKEITEATNDITLDEVDKLMLRGGWPQVIAENIEDSSSIVSEYIDDLANLKHNKLFDFRVDKEVCLNILKSLARLNTGAININTILKDINNEMSRETLDKYLDALYGLNVLFKVPVWGDANKRSSYKIRTKPKTYFCDTSLVCNLLDINDISDFYEDGSTTGLIFETQVMKDLSVYAEAIGAKLYYFRDEKGNEIDAILELKNGKWAAIEIKLSLTLAMEAIETLDKNVSLLNKSKMFSEPSFKAIITNADRVYKSKNNTYVIPHTLLRP